MHLDARPSGRETPDKAPAPPDMPSRSQQPSPADLYRELFVDVQTARIFRDSKSFVDSVPKADPAKILDDYRAEKSAAAVFQLAIVNAQTATHASRVLRIHVRVDEV